MRPNSTQKKPAQSITVKIKYSLKTIICVAGASMMSMGPAIAQNVFITPDIPYVEFDNGREFFVIERNQDAEARIPDFFTMTSRQCPPFCIQPMSGGEGVTTVGELEVLEFMQQQVTNGTGLIVDARLNEWYLRGTIPGATNLPFTLFDNPANNPFLVPVLKALGGVQADDGNWDMSDARELLMFCDGQWCGQSHMAIGNLMKIGYPGEKIRYYRDGMQGWLTVGLTVEMPSQ